MKGNPKIIEILNQLLNGELTAMDQYFVHAHMYEDWGLNELYERINHESQDERGHAAKLIARILFLEGTPDIEKRNALTIGNDVQEMLELDLQYEYKVAASLRTAIDLCEQHNDYQTREILEVLLEETEDDHMHWLEQQVTLIKMIGLQNYIQTKMS